MEGKLTMHITAVWTSIFDIHITRDIFSNNGDLVTLLLKQESGRKANYTSTDNNNTCRHYE